MKKITTLKFNENTSLKEIKSQMLTYQSYGQIVRTKINGIEFTSDDPDFEKIFEILELNLPEKETKEMISLERDIRVHNGRITNAKKIENNEMIRFYYGLAKTMIKEEGIDEFETLFNIYPNGRFYNELVLLTKIMLALEQENKLQIFREINQVFSSSDSLDDINIDKVLSWVKTFSKKGELVDEVFFAGTTKKYIDSLNKKIEDNYKRKQEIIFSYKKGLKYKNTTLYGTNNFQFKLDKYNDNYRSILDNFTNPDESLISYVKSCPKIYSETSDYQSYIILNKDYFCIGIIYFNPSSDELDLEVKLQLDEKKFESELDMYNTVNQIIDVLGHCYSDKNNIEVNLVNNIDLSKYDSKYQKRIYDENLTTYIFPNKINGKKRIYIR